MSQEHGMFYGRRSLQQLHPLRSSTRLDFGINFITAKTIFILTFQYPEAPFWVYPRPHLASNWFRHVHYVQPTAVAEDHVV